MRQILVLSLLLSLPLFAADKPLLGVPGALVYENALEKLPDGWTAPKGEWTGTDGVLRGAERAADNHGAVIRMAKPLADCILQFEVKLDGAKGISLSINDKTGHLARVGLTPTSMRVAKDDHDHDGPDKAVAFALYKMDAQTGTWHTVRMEIVGREMLGQVDGTSGFGEHEQLAAPKTNLGLTVAGQSASFRNLKIWEATPNPDWPAMKAALPKGEAPPAPTRKAATQK